MNHSLSLSNSVRNCDRQPYDFSPDFEVFSAVCQQNSTNNQMAPFHDIWQKDGAYVKEAHVNFATLNHDCYSFIVQTLQINGLSFNFNGRCT